MYNTNYENGLALSVLNVSKKDVHKAFELFKLAKEEGCKESYYQIGRFYALGEGVARNYSKAKKYYEDGIQKGCLLCNVALAMLYYLGHGVKQDLNTSHDLVIPILSELERRANQKDPIFAYMTGLVYYYGLNNKQDVLKALMYFQLSCKLKHVDALYMQALIIEKAATNSEQRNRALEFYHKAADQGHVHATFALGVHHLDVEEYDIAEEYLLKAAKANYDLALFSLGIFYKEVMKDDVLSFKYLKKASDLNYKHSLYYTGLAYYLGKGVEKDIDKAEGYFKRAVYFNDEKAMYQYGLLLIRERKDFESAFKLLNLAAQKNHLYAQYNLAVMYQRGDGVEKDLEKAYFYFTQAAEHGFANAQYNLGNMYLSGDVVKKDLEKAKEYFKLAANQGLAEAKDILVKLSNAKWLDETMT